MPIYRFGTRYSRWDGTQQVSPLDADDLMNAMSDQLMRDGDLMNALRRLFWEGLDRPDGDRMPGLRELMNRLKQRRQEQLSRYDMGSMLDDIRERLQDILNTENQGIDRRLQEAGIQPQNPPDTADGESGEEAQSAEGSQSGQQSSRSEQGQQAGGQQSQLGSAQESATGDPDLQQMLQNIANKKREQLDNL